MSKTVSSNIVFTIGHSTHDPVRFVELLRRHHINILADVRSIPYSRWQPHFNREQLTETLENHGIEYLYLGQQLGGMDDDKRYCEMAQTKSFASGIQRVIDASQRKIITLMCSEKDPIDCHRALLVARSLVASGLVVEHIFNDGHLENHNETVKRLYEHLGHSENQLDLFDDAAQDRNDALYKEQEARVRNRKQRTYL